MNDLAVSGVCLDAQALQSLRHVARYGRVSSAGRWSALPGRSASHRRGQGIEIDDIRAWSPGDDMRHLDRNVTARTGAPHVRTFRAERERMALLVADFRPSMLFGTKRAFRSVAAAEALTLVGWRLVANGDRVGLLTIAAGEAAFVRPSNGERSMMAVIGGMIKVHAAALADDRVADTPLDAHLEMASRVMSRGGTVILATALETPGDRFDAVVRGFARRAAVGVILVTDAFERSPPPGAYAFLTGDDHVTWATIGDKDASQRVDGRLARLAELGVRAVRVDAELDPAAMVPALERLNAWTA